YPSVVISPATTTSPVVSSVSHATRDIGSCVMSASRTESEIWSAILSGCPSVTDSEVKVQRVMLSPWLSTGRCEAGGDGVHRGGCDVLLGGGGRFDRCAFLDDSEIGVCVVGEPDAGSGDFVGAYQVRPLGPHLGEGVWAQVLPPRPGTSCLGGES